MGDGSSRAGHYRLRADDDWEKDWGFCFCVSAALVAVERTTTAAACSLDAITELRTHRDAEGEDDGDWGQVVAVGGTTFAFGRCCTVVVAAISLLIQ